ncbi:MAG: RNA-binding S4 domain-containing protein [Solirubrobacterales bacterium]
MDEPVRIDKWLWAARFVKTRALGAEAVRGGRRDQRPAREAQQGGPPGDRVAMTLGSSRVCVDVRATAVRRGPASEAALLYEETAESRAERRAHADAVRGSGAAQQRRLAKPPPAAAPGGRPTKRDRRRFEAGRGRR